MSSPTSTGIDPASIQTLMQIYSAYKEDILSDRSSTLVAALNEEVATKESVSDAIGRSGSQDGTLNRNQLAKVTGNDPVAATILLTAFDSCLPLFPRAPG